MRNLAKLDINLPLDIYTDSLKVAVLLKQKGFGNKTFLTLLQMFEVNEIVNLKLPKVLIDRLKIRRLLNQEIKQLAELLFKLDIGIKGIWEEDYPKALREIYNPPAILYYKGTWNYDLFNNCISIVGTRTPSTYGLGYAREFAEKLSDLNYTLVSGMALGIDKEVHKATLKKDSNTIAVLAGSVHEPSPLANKYVYEEILQKNGLIISEFPPGTKVTPGMFAHRNRIIAGISKATIVIEAREKSGALITGDLAFENNREVFALPGNIDSVTSMGCNNLIKFNKAKPITSVADVLRELSYL